MTLLKTKLQRRLYWKTIDRLQSNSIKRTADLVQIQFRRDKKAAADNVIKGTPEMAGQAATAAMAAQADEWLVLDNRIYATNFVEFGNKVVADFQKALVIDEATKQRWELLSQEYVRNTVAQRIPNLLANSNSTIQRVIEQGIQDGKGVAVIARDIRAQQSNFSRGRALRVARTEVIASSNLGSIEGAREVDPRMLKEWIATPDGLTRETHVSADGQTQKLDDPFIVGGSPLMFPGDTSLGAPASETINERCTLAYIPQPVRQLTGAS